MLIECVIDRPEPVIVPIGNEIYRFEEDALGRKVAEVWLESHIESFLAVSHLYRPVAPLPTVRPQIVVSPPAVKREDDLASVRAEYQRITGKRPFNGWNVEILREKMAAKAA